MDDMPVKMNAIIHNNNNNNNSSNTRTCIRRRHCHQDIGNNDNGEDERWVFRC